MMFIKKAAAWAALIILPLIAFGQTAKSNLSQFSLHVVNEKSEPVIGATVALQKAGKPVKLASTNADGNAIFEKIADGAYTFLITYTGYQSQTTATYQFPSSINTGSISLQPANKVLNEVSIVAKKNYIEQAQGKVVLNVDASPTNIGATVLEVLEKSPGVTVDRNGGIALQGKPGVLVMIDDKPTYLSGDDLNNMLSSMNASQVEQIELIANPSAKYDANGNAGVINIKTKKNKQRGFNGSFTAAAGQGIYPKDNNTLILNYRAGKLNTFLNYSMNLSQYLTSLYALRKYYNTSGNVTAMLDQPAYFTGTVFNNTLKTGFDYAISPKTTVGMVLSGTTIHRKGNNNSQGNWLDAAGVADSAIATLNKRENKFKNGAINLNGRHSISATQDISADFDWLHYDLSADQDFNNTLLAPGGYQEASRGNIPTTINIVSGKVDYSLKAGKAVTFQTGVKTSYSSTDNIASYQNLLNGAWVADYTKSNHFLYNERIDAAYATIEKKGARLSMQAGLRYEHSGYHGDQLGNVLQKDSAFSRNYGGLFPSGYIAYVADSLNSFNLTIGRRIDRPVYQNLNPFYNIINKYTYQTGNPFLLPQYSWNLELSHQYNNLFSTTVSYSIIQNYFSQLFLADKSPGILLYTQGNVGHTYNFGLEEMLTASPLKWWSFTADALYNYKQLVGFNGNSYTSYSSQLHVSLSNQFSFAKVYTAEISGMYTTRARVDVQEQLYPTGQLSVGLSKPVFKKKATLKLSARDLLRTNNIEGLTQFPGATEYFKLHGDTRVVTLSLTYRFGKAYKTTKHDAGSAKDEADRVGNG